MFIPRRRLRERVRSRRASGDRVTAERTDLAHQPPARIFGQYPLLSQRLVPVDLAIPCINPAKRAAAEVGPRSRVGLLGVADARGAAGAPRRGRLWTHRGCTARRRPYAVAPKITKRNPGTSSAPSSSTATGPSTPDSA